METKPKKKRKKHVEEFKREAVRLVGDITYIWPAEGWAYLAVLLDLFSRSGRRLGPAQVSQP